MHFINVSMNNEKLVLYPMMFLSQSLVRS